MINSLRLQYFRKHLDRSFEFTSGINAIRGENENGKTTVLEGFAYLVFGARALKESLEDVVTYDQPVSKLRVDGVLTIMGVTYTAYRAKSGAEVTFGNGQRVTGQTEVTAFFEQLFGVDAKMAGKLMISSQKAIAESITAGPTDAGKLIEDLANFNLITDLVEDIQLKVPTGTTTAAEARVTQLREQAGKAVEVEDLTPLRASVEEAQEASSLAGEKVAGIGMLRDQLDVPLANAILADEKACQAAIETAAYELSILDGKLSVAAPIAPEAGEIERARAAVEAEKGLARAAKVHAELTAAKIVDLWDKDLPALEKEIAETEAKAIAAGKRCDAAVGEIGTLSLEMANLRADSGAARATLEGKLIKETSCAFCDKDLTDVPEVVTRNSRLGDELIKLKRNTDDAELSIKAKSQKQAELRDAADAERKEAADYLKALRAVVTRNDKVEALYAGAGDLINVNRATVPGLWTWAGPSLESDGIDKKAALVILEKRQHDVTAFEAAREVLQKERGAWQLKKETAVLKRSGLQVKDATETLEEAKEFDAQLAVAEEALRAAQGALTAAKNELATKEALQAQAARAAQLAKEQLEQAEKDLAEMVANNLLVKKLKSARPTITNKLWSIVLSGASGHLTQVRETPSAITRDEKMFRVNGKPAAGLSGAGEDMLGLAVRISLTKTFLGALGFLILDEPGAACSDARESTMLGMLSTLGFDQILLITHSDLCESFADNLITV